MSVERVSAAPAGAGPANPMDRRSLGLSLALHAAALAALIWGLPALARDPVVYQAVEVRIVSTPPAPAPPREEETPPAPQEEELVVETPEEPAPPREEDDAPAPVEEEAPPPEPEETPPPEPEETPVPDDHEETPAPEVEDPPPPVDDPAPAEPEETQEDGGENINVRLDGVKRDHPAYYDNIIRQINRCFRPTDGENLRAVVRFAIRRDGSVAEIGMSERSGDIEFDVRAQEAIECAGRQGRLGPLPSGYSWDVLPVQFTFWPRSAP